MKKKLFSFTLLSATLLSLSACAPSLDGTYKGKADGVEYILVVEGKDASLEINALIFGMDLEGPIDTSKKTMDLSGSMMGQDINETATYTFKDNAMILEIKGETITLEKE